MSSTTTVGKCRKSDGFEDVVESFNSGISSWNGTATGKMSGADDEDFRLRKVALITGVTGQVSEWYFLH